MGYSQKPKVDDSGVTRYLSPDEEAALRDALRRRDDAGRERAARYNAWLQDCLSRLRAENGSVKRREISALRKQYAAKRCGPVDMTHHPSKLSSW